MPTKIKDELALFVLAAWLAVVIGGGVVTAELPYIGLDDAGNLQCVTFIPRASAMHKTTTVRIVCTYKL